MARPVVICRGHGITSAAATVPQAVLQAISLDALARMSLRVRSAGGTLRDIDDADWDDLPDLGPSFTAEAAWRHEVARLEPLSRVDRQSPWPPWVSAAATAEYRELSSRFAGCGGVERKPQTRCPCRYRHRNRRDAFLALLTIDGVAPLADTPKARASNSVRLPME